MTHDDALAILASLDQIWRCLLILVLFNAFIMVFTIIRRGSK